MRNYGTWCEANSRSGSRSAQLYSTLALGRRPDGPVEVTGLVTAEADSQHQTAEQLTAEQLVAEHLTAIGDGVPTPASRDRARTTWLGHALDPAPGLAGVHLEQAVFKLKDALLRRRFTDQQIDVAFDHLTRTDHDVALTWGMATYGGAVNDVPSHATASAHRDAVLTTSVTAGWLDPQDEAAALTWTRRFYRDLFADAGGVPVPSAGTAGASINHPDVDLADPTWNSSGVPWHAIYYRDNYRLLQAVKDRWDPLDVFHHALSIRPRGTADPVAGSV